jgi:anti-sigma regulatory factor (Ser/Thr protein kinase)
MSGRTSIVTAALRPGSAAAEHGSGAGPAFQSKEGAVLHRDDWPLSSSLELGALPSAVSCARLHARQVTWEWGLGELSDSIELIVSELVTNAIHASQSGRLPSVRLWLYSDKQRVLVQVWDGNHRLPTPQDAELEAEGGRGLLLVESLSTDWGTYRPDGWNGKVMWAVTSQI